MMIFLSIFVLSILDEYINCLVCIMSDKSEKSKKKAIFKWLLCI